MRIRFPALSRGACLAAIVNSAVCCAFAADSAPPPVVVIDADEIVVDRPQVEWAEGYLQWIASFARDNSPISDTTGAQCAAKQRGEVWFLASSDGTASVDRTCAIPAGKTLFVPIVSTMERSNSREPNCAAMARLAAAALARVSRLSMTIDGQRLDDLPSHRLPTGECFALGARQTAGSSAKAAVADGYYVMLQPLPPGAHTIAVAARIDNTTLSTTYRLDVH